MIVARPDVAVETGVAAGHSSQAILSALKIAGTGGHLWSSDFPYLKETDPDAAIGWVVDPNLKTDWTLLVDGDRVNLPLIVHDLGDRKIDLLHYDSDKSIDGRKFALSVLKSSISENAIIVLDYIQDNFHFLDWIQGIDMANKQSRIFKIGNKYVGLVGGSTLQSV